MELSKADLVTIRNWAIVAKYCDFKFSNYDLVIRVEKEIGCNKCKVDNCKFGCIYLEETNKRS